jgi:hypothetical protein
MLILHFLNQHNTKPMKTISRFLAVAAFSFVCFAFMSQNSSGIAASISKKGFKINKVNISSDWNITGLLNELGSPDSIYSGYNKLHIYKSKGIVVFEKMESKRPSGTISEVQFFINKNTDDNTYKLSADYTGKLVMDKLVLEPSLSYATAKAKLSKWKLTDSYTAHSYRYARHGVYIYLLFNTSETELMKVSVGKDNK